MIPKLEPKNFERTINDRQTSLTFISNDKLLKAAFSNYGARIISLMVDGINVTPSFSSLEPYTTPNLAPFHGATIGRYANRIARGKFKLKGKKIFFTS